MKKTPTEGPRALVISTSRDRGALAAVRSLRQSGWVVGVGTPDGGGMLGASVACSARHVVPRPRLDGAAFIEGVRRAVALGSYDIVFGGGDDWMAALATYRDDIPTRVAHPPADVVNAALNKVELSALAHQIGLSAPRTVQASDEAIEQWQGPVVVKCLTHWAHGQTRPHRIEAKLFPDIISAGPQIERVRKAGAEPILQEPIKGHLGALIGIFHDGHLDGRVQQVTSRLWPTPNGVSTRAETVRVDEDLAARVEALLRELGWWGLVELQFLIDDDGVHHLIDLNGRFFGSMALTNAARPGLTDLWGRLVLGEKMQTLPDAAPGMRYAWTAGDLRRASVEQRGGRVADVVDTLRWAGQARHSVWDLKDPGPTLHLASARLRRIDRKPKSVAAVTG
ncbi:ATP-grasp domain-containing protein [Arthrobacter sp. Sr33]